MFFMDPYCQLKDVIDFTLLRVCRNREIERTLTYYMLFRNAATKTAILYVCILTEMFSFVIMFTQKIRFFSKTVEK